MNYRVRKIYDLFRYAIPRFLGNVWYFRSSLANTYDFDYSGSLYFMREHFKQLEPTLRNGYHLNGDKTADKVKVCILLLDRILDSSEQYSLSELDLDFSGKRVTLKRKPKNSEHPRHGTKTYWEVTKIKEDQDWELLMKMLNKHMRSFWS